MATSYHGSDTGGGGGSSGVGGSGSGVADRAAIWTNTTTLAAVGTNNWYIERDSSDFVHIYANNVKVASFKYAAISGSVSQHDFLSPAGTGGMQLNASNGDGFDLRSLNSSLFYLRCIAAQVGLNYGSYSAMLSATGLDVITAVSGAFGVSAAGIRFGNGGFALSLPVSMTDATLNLTSAQGGAFVADGVLSGNQDIILPQGATCKTHQVVPVYMEADGATYTVTVKPHATDVSGGKTISGNASHPVGLTGNGPWDKALFVLMPSGNWHHLAV